MISFTQAKQWSDGPVSFYGLASDTKPTTYAAPGNDTQAVPERSTFLETDTGDEYFYTGTQWILFVRTVDFNTDSANFDSFARMRVSEPETLFDSKQIHNNQALFWDDQEVSGSGTSSTWSQDTASSVMAVSTAAGNRTRQTFRRFNYQPGKSQLVLITGTLDDSGGGAGITRCMGLYDDNNGILLQDDEGTYKVVKRSNVTGSAVDTKISQTDWNLDTMDGSGSSAITLDFTKSQILIIDLEWLGVGRVRIGFVIDGIPIYAHQFLHSNVVQGVYMSTPNLPIRYEIENDGTGVASGIEHICCSVVSEGGAEDIGVNMCNSNGATAVVAATSGTIYALCGLKLKAANLDGVVKVVGLTTLEINTVDYEWVLCFNPTLNGTAPTFSNQSNSVTQFAVGTAVNTIDDANVGTVIDSGYVKGGKESGADGQILDTAQILGSAIAGTADEVWLAARPLAINADFLGGIAWREIS